MLNRSVIQTGGPPVRRSGQPLSSQWVSATRNVCNSTRKPSGAERRSHKRCAKPRSLPRAGANTIAGVGAVRSARKWRMQITRHLAADAGHDGYCLRLYLRGGCHFQRGCGDGFASGLSVDFPDSRQVSGHNDMAPPARDGTIMAYWRLDRASSRRRTLRQRADFKGRASVREQRCSRRSALAAVRKPLQTASKNRC